MHQLALLKAENQNLRQANEVLSKRRRAKRTCLRRGELLSQQEAQNLQDESTVVQQVEQETKASSGGSQGKRVHAAVASVRLSIKRALVRL